MNAFTQPPPPSNNTGNTVDGFEPPGHRSGCPQPTSQTNDEGNQSPHSAGKEKRHRNKPSLSCNTCTVKKTKCDRTRPVCFACQKRKTECYYSQVADLIEESHRTRGIDGPRKRQRAGKPGTVSQTSPSASGGHHGRQVGSPTGILPPLPSVIHDDYRPADRTPSRSSSSSAPTLLSNIPFSCPTVSNLFKVEVGLPSSLALPLAFPNSIH